MAKQIKIPRKTKGPVEFFSPGSGLSWEDKLYMLAGGLSPFSLKGNPAGWGGRAWLADQADTHRRAASRLGRVGRAGMGIGRFFQLTNPWVMAPAALAGLAKYSVGKAFDPYRDETGRIGEAGHAQLASAARAREALMAQRNLARQNRNSGGLASILNV